MLSIPLLIMKVTLIVQVLSAMAPQAEYKANYKIELNIHHEISKYDHADK
jgi:hypothetical protein